VGAGFVEFGREVLRGDGAAMADEAIVLGLVEIQKAGLGAGGMRRMAVFAAVIRDGGAGRVRPGVLSGAIPCGPGQGMGGVVPEAWDMAVQADGGSGVILDQELAVLVPVRVVAGGALNLPVTVEADLLLQR